MGAILNFAVGQDLLIKVFEKKLLTKERTHDILYELRLGRAGSRTLTNKQQCNPEHS